MKDSTDLVALVRQGRSLKNFRTPDILRTLREVSASYWDAEDGRPIAIVAALICRELVAKTRGGRERLLYTTEARNWDLRATR